MSEFSSLPPGIFTSGSATRKKVEKSESEKKQAAKESVKDSDENISVAEIAGDAGTEFPVYEKTEDENTDSRSGTEFPHETVKDESADDDPGTEFPLSDGPDITPYAAEEAEQASESVPEPAEDYVQKLKDDVQEDDVQEDDTSGYEDSYSEKKSRMVSSAAFSLKLIVICVQGVAEAMALWQVNALHMLPLKYMAAAVAVSAVFLILTYLGFFVGRKRWQKIVCGILSVVLTATSCAAIWYAGNTASFRKKSFGAARYTEMTTYLVIARKGRYTKSSQLKGRMVETGPESETQNEALAKLQKKVSVRNVPVTGYDVLDCDLMKDRTDAIMIEDSATSILNETDKSFSSKTTVLMRIRVPRVASGSAAYTGNGQPFTVFVSGSDSRGGVKETARSDVDMLLTVNPKKKKVLMTSIPRDYFVTIHGKGAKDKLTHAGLLGIDTLKATVHDFMKVKIDYYLKVNFTSVTTLVDELGGIDIYSDQDIKLWTYPGHQNKPLSKGWHHMNGKTALAFARERHSYETGDRHRAENQQAVLKAIAGKLMSGRTLTNYASILKSISSMFVTDIPDSLISDLVTAQLDGGSWTFSSYILECTEEMRSGGYFMPTRKLYYAIPVQKSMDKARKQIEEMRSEGEAAPSNTDNSLQESKDTKDTEDTPDEDETESSPSSDEENESTEPSVPITQEEAAL